MSGIPRLPVLLLAALCPFGFTGAAGATVASSVPETALTLGEARPVNRLVMGLNTPVSLAGNANVRDGHRESMTPLFRRMFLIARPTIVRYPGGTMANFWDWQNNTILPDDIIFRTSGMRPGPNAWFIKLRDKLQSPAARADAARETFARLAAEIDAKILWVPNIVTDYEHMAATFAEFPRQGLPLDYVELGNEVSQSFYTHRWPTVDDYLREMAPLIATMRQVSPAVKIAYSGDENFGSFEGSSSAFIQRGSDERQQADRRRSVEWAERLLRSGNPGDFIAHSYLGYEDRSVAEERGLFKKLTPAQTVDYLLAGPQNVDARMRELRGTTSRKIWLTEYNIGFNIGAPNEYIDTMAAALFVASWQIIGFTHDDYEMMLLHSISGPFGFLAPAGDTQVSASPAAQLFTQMGALVRWAATVRPLAFASPPTLPGYGRWTGTTRPALQGVCFERAGACRLVLLNLGSRPCRVALPARLGSARGSTWVVAAATKPLRARLPDGDDTGPLTQPVTAQEFVTEADAVTLLAYSFTVLASGSAMP